MNEEYQGEHEPSVCFFSDRKGNFIKYTKIDKKWIPDGEYEVFPGYYVPNDIKRELQNTYGGIWSYEEWDY